MCASRNTFTPANATSKRANIAKLRSSSSTRFKIDPAMPKPITNWLRLTSNCRKAQGAYQELARTIELQPENYQARIELANLLILGPRFQHAQEQTDLLLQKRPNDPVVHSTVSSLLTGQGDLSGAMAEIEKAIALNPGGWPLYLELAMLQLRTNQTDAAEASLKKVIELHPAATQAHLLLGTFYQSRSRFAEAEQQFHAAMDMGPRTRKRGLRSPACTWRKERRPKQRNS